MRTQLREWKTAVVATSPHAPKALAAGWILTRLVVYEAAIILPIKSWAAIIPLPSISIFIIAIATSTINVLSASTDAARLLNWLDREDDGVFLMFVDWVLKGSRFHERILNQILVSSKIGLSIAIPLALVACAMHPDKINEILLFSLPSLILSLTAILLTPMPLGSWSPHWCPITIQLCAAHALKPLMEYCVETINWRAVQRHSKWSFGARALWIVGRINAALIWQIPSLVLFYVAQGWLWPTTVGTWIGLSFIILSSGLTAFAATGAAIEDWRRIATTLKLRDVSIDCYGVVETMLASLDNQPTSRTTPDLNALLMIQLIAITVGLVVGRAAYSLPVAILFLTFFAYSQIHAIAWSYAGLTVRLPCPPPVVEETVIRRPPDEVVGGAKWTSESEIKAKADDILKHAQQGLEED